MKWDSVNISKHAFLLFCTVTALGQGQVQSQSQSQSQSQPQTQASQNESPFSGQVGFYTQGIAGTASTIHNPEVQAELTYTKGNVYFDFLGSNLDWIQDTDPTSYVSGGSLEMDLSAGIIQQWTADLTNDTGVTYYVFPGVPRQPPLVPPPIPMVTTVSANSLQIYDTLSWKWLSASIYLNPIDQLYGILNARGSGNWQLALDIPIGAWFSPLPKLKFHALWGGTFFAGTDPRNSIYNSNVIPGAPYDTTPSNATIYNYNNYLLGLSSNLPQQFIVGFNYTNTYGSNVLGWGSRDQCVTPGFCGPYSANLAAAAFVVYVTKNF